MSALPVTALHTHGAHRTAGKVSAATFARIRDYAVDEPSFTIPFAAWELGLSPSLVDHAVKDLHRAGIVKQIEPAKGPYAATYQYDPPKPSESERHVPASAGRFRELDDARLAGVGIDAQPRGVVVPHTRPQGPSGRPGRDKKRQARGVKVKRNRQGT
jgi:hypothetical protein